MANTRFTPAADHHVNAIRTAGGTVARAVAVLLSIAQTSTAMLADNYALSAHRSGVNHV